MINLKFTTTELKMFNEEMPFTPLQWEIIKARREEGLSNVQIEMKHNISSKILNKELKDISFKISKAIEQMRKNGKI